MMPILLGALLLAGIGNALAFDPFASAGIDQRPGAQVPLDAAFRDDAGRAVTLRALGGGRPILLVPVLHRCPNICGVTLAGLGQAVRAQRYAPGRDFALIAFGIDPAEGPDAAHAALGELRKAVPSLPRDAIHALTGEAESVAGVTGALGYRYAWDDDIGQYAHVAAVAVLTPDGRLARWLYGVAPNPADLDLALTEAGQGSLGTWRDQLLLLCYHYDPATGRYGSLVSTALRVFGGITAVGGAGLIGLALLRERRAPNGRGRG
ncbi:MAG: SCO family protein [Alphaproteobacteria bacterium]